MSATLLAICLLAADPLGPGNHSKTIEVDGRSRSYLVHVPKGYNAEHPTPVVLIYHGAGTSALIMIPFCGMNEKSEEAGFIAVYPNGTGLGLFRTFNVGGLKGRIAASMPDDVKYTAALLNDLQTVVNVNENRVYATGISNGGMMCYRLAAELSDRIAAIAPVSGTMTTAEAKPDRPVPIMHLHGMADRIVPYNGPDEGTLSFLTFKSVDETIQTWAKINECAPEPVVEKLEDKSDDGTSVTRSTFRSQEVGADIVLIKIEGGGHTWPGKQPPVTFIGKSTKDISANDMIWEFFQQHRLRRKDE